MDEPFYEDWPEEREEVIDDTLDQIRDQRDEAQENDLRGKQEINPHLFTTGNHMVVGPILFETAFTDAPNITFGEQQTGVNQADVPATSTATNYSPFLVHPYVYQLKMDRGIVDGFYLGLYAITTPIPGVFTHIISWRAAGKASVYKDERTEESWMEDYDQNDTDYLVEDAGEEYIDDLPEEDSPGDPGDDEFEEF